MGAQEAGPRDEALERLAYHFVEAGGADISLKQLVAEDAGKTALFLARYEGNYGGADDLAELRRVLIPDPRLVGLKGYDKAPEALESRPMDVQIALDQAAFRAEEFARYRRRSRF